MYIDPFIRTFWFRGMFIELWSSLYVVGSVLFDPVSFLSSGVLVVHLVISVVNFIQYVSYSSLYILFDYDVLCLAFLKAKAAGKG